MFSKLFVTSIVLGLTLQVSGHAIINPAIGINGTAKRADAQRVTTANPCGKRVNVATALSSANNAITLNGDTFTTTVTNFNRGQDGSRQVTARVDATGTGQKFVSATVTKNGDKAPKDNGSQQITVKLPAGTTCTGGSGKDTCLVAFKTAGNFGNCVAVKQGAATGNKTTTAATNGTNAKTKTNSTTKTGKGNTSNKAGNTGNNATNGTTATATNKDSGLPTVQLVTGVTIMPLSQAPKPAPPGLIIQPLGNGLAAVFNETITKLAKNGGRDFKSPRTALNAERSIDVRAVASRAARFYRELEALATREPFVDTDEDGNQFISDADEEDPAP